MLICAMRHAISRSVTLVQFQSIDRRYASRYVTLVQFQNADLRYGLRYALRYASRSASRNASRSASRSATLCHAGAISRILIRATCHALPRYVRNASRYVTLL